MRQKNMKRHVLNTGYGLFLLILAFPLWACSYEEGRSYYRAKQYEKAHACFMQPENRQNPKAWNTLPITIQKPANIKLRLMILRAGTPIVSICSEALNIASSLSGKIWKTRSPTIMMDTA